MDLSVAKDVVPWLNAALHFFYPEVCQICKSRRAVPAQGYVCESCSAAAKFIERPFCVRCGMPFEGEISTAFECGRCREEEFQFSYARAAVQAHDVVLEVIHRYKYKRALWFEPFLAGLLVRRAVPELQQKSWDCIVPVPLHPTKYREREFNQAERLARHLGNAADIPLDTKSLRRITATRTQTRLTREERHANVRRAFGVRPGANLAGKRIIVVDDVFTTGATTNACAMALVKAGAAEVCVWTAARGV